MYLPSLPTIKDQGVYILSCPEDKQSLVKIKKSRVPVMDKEFILSGILRYKLDLSLLLQ